MIEVRVRRAVRQGRVYWRVYPDAAKPQYLRVWSEPAAERVASDLRALHAKHAAEDLAEGVDGGAP